MKSNVGRLRALVAVLAVLVSMVLSACGSGGSSSDMPAGAPEPAVGGDGGALPMPEKGGEEGSGDGDRLIIRTKVLRLEVESTPDAVDEIRSLARTHEGSVTDMQVATETDEWLYRYEKDGMPSGDGSALRGWVTARVPVETYEDFLTAVAALGVVKFQSEATSDVTQEHVDLSARLENLRAQEVRLREFFEAAKNVKDMLAIETELGRVRGEIESLDAQVTYLERQAAMATVTIELTEPRPVVSPGGQSWGFRDAITNGVRGAASLLTGLLTFLIATAPVWALALVLFFPVRTYLRRRAARREADLRPETPPVKLEGEPPAP